VSHADDGFLGGLIPEFTALESVGDIDPQDGGAEKKGKTGGEAYHAFMLN
jgi:hypothetical protein